MSIAYKRRKKAIELEKRKLKWSNHVDPKAFALLQANWAHEQERLK